MNEEQFFEEVKRDMGVDPDQLVFDRIVRDDYANLLRESSAGAYSSDMEMTAVPIPNERILNAEDRCDRCGARATTVATFGEMELLFCDHHTTEQKSGLEGKGWTVTSSEG